MTIAKCTAKCFSLGYPLAGVEFAHECFCADSVGSSGGPVTTGCDMKCTGNPSETCGGADRLNVFKYAGASPLPSTGDWVLDSATGCYTDAVTNRALGLRVYVDGPMTVPKCTAKCFSLNYGYAGLEFADECYCSHSIGSSGVQATDGCTMPCSGDMSTICGGPDRITIYKYQGNALTTQPTVLESYSNFVSQGCYVDSVQARLMTPMDVVGQMTVEKCIDACSAAEYDVAAVEFGSECYCSVDLPAESFKATDNCNMPCAGAADYLCGGANRLNIYQYQPPTTGTSTSSQIETSTSTSTSSTSTPTSSTSTSTSSTSTSTSATASWSWEYKSCHKLDIMNLPGWMTQRFVVTDFRNTVEGCTNMCQGFSYRTAMLSGADCFCIPNALDLASDYTCTTPCPGNTGQICGFDNPRASNNYAWALSVYTASITNVATTASSTTPTTTPCMNKRASMDFNCAT